MRGTDRRDRAASTISCYPAEVTGDDLIAGRRQRWRWRGVGEVA